ncbi:hypothetical protein JCM10207_002988 [Rhodosporidiobolus poonsookiae]
MSASMERTFSLHGDAYLPPRSPPETREHRSLSRLRTRARSTSRGREVLDALFHRPSSSHSRGRSDSLPASEHGYAGAHDPAHSDGASETDLSDEAGEVRGVYPSLSGGASSGMFSREARQERRQQRQRAYSQPEPPSPLSPFSSADGPARGGVQVFTPSPVSPYSPFSPLSPASPYSPFRSSASAGAMDEPLFAPSFTPRQLARLQRASQHTQDHEAAHDARAAKKEAKREKGGSVRAEMKIAMGVLEMVEEKKKVAKKEKKERSRSRGRERTSVGGVEPHDAAPAGGASSTEQHLVGLFEEVEQRFVSRPLSAPAAGVTAGHGASAAGLMGGAAALMGVVGTGVEWYEREKRKKREEQGVSRPTSATSTAARATTSHPAIRPASAASIASAPAPAAPAHPSLPLSLHHPLTTPLPPPGQAQPKVYLSSLTPSEHHLVQHAAAALLLKDRARGTLHEALHEAVGGIERLVHWLEHGVEKAWEEVKRHRPHKLFGTPLHTLTHHEGTDSHHGVDPHGTVRVPEFVDHVVTAMMLKDPAKTSGILRKSGSLRVVNEIVAALDHSGKGQQTVVDLAAVDPITLADIFKRFLAALPDPILTGHLFKLFIACSHIHHVGLRRRAMHLVICLMPKVNRDVMEVVFLFLDWLSVHGHVDVKVGNEMVLSNIAKLMAPTLLRPHHRAPKPVELDSMIAAVLQLLEDQHVLHEIPYELASVLHIQHQIPPQAKTDSASLVQHLARLL